MLMEYEQLLGFIAAMDVMCCFAVERQLGSNVGVICKQLPYEVWQLGGPIPADQHHPAIRTFLVAQHSVVVDHG